MVPAENWGLLVPWGGLWGQGSGLRLVSLGTVLQGPPEGWGPGKQGMGVYHEAIPRTNIVTLIFSPPALKGYSWGN